MLMAAVGTALRPKARRGVERDDLISEALLRVLAAFKRHRNLRYDPFHGGRFESWVYAIWKNAIREGTIKGQVRSKGSGAVLGSDQRGQEPFLDNQRGQGQSKGSGGQSKGSGAVLGTIKGVRSRSWDNQRVRDNQRGQEPFLSLRGQSKGSGAVLEPQNGS